MFQMHTAKWHPVTLAFFPDKDTENIVAKNLLLVAKKLCIKFTTD